MSGLDRYRYNDFRNDIPLRVFGSETEFTDDGSFGETVNQSYDSNGMMPRPSSLLEVMDNSHVVSFSNYMNHNDIITCTGGRLYLDCESIEYATPECRTPDELVVHERAGEIFARSALVRWAKNARKPPKTLYRRSGYADVYANNSRLIYEDSIGYHENYSSVNEFSRYHNYVIGRLNESKSAQQFADYLALRKIIDGIGMVEENGYSISQRPRAVDFRKFGSTTSHGSKRPFYQKGDRMEVRSGEGSKSDWSTSFKFGLTSLILRLVEHEAFPSRLSLADPNGAVRTLSKDPLGLVHMTYREDRRGIDVLKEMVDTAVQLVQSYPDFPKYEQQAAKDFYKFYDDIQLVSLIDHEVSSLADRIDWAARYEYLIERGATHKTITTNDLNQVRDDLRWDMIGERDIARRHFAKFGHTVLQAGIPEPPNTRAKGRVELAQKLFADENLQSVSWDEVQSWDGVNYVLNNPLSATTIYALGAVPYDSMDKE